MTKVKSICLVCRGKKEVIDKVTKLYRPCVACNNTGWIYVNQLGNTAGMPTTHTSVAQSLIINKPRNYPQFTVVINAIIEYQKVYLKSLDIKDLRPMRLKDIEQMTGVDVSSICNCTKDVDIDGVPVKSLFTTEIAGLSNRVVKAILQDVIDKENKKNPYTDQQLTYQMKFQHNIELARRTVTKYRVELGIPARPKRIRNSSPGIEMNHTIIDDPMI